MMKSLKISVQISKKSRMRTQKLMISVWSRFRTRKVLPRVFKMTRIMRFLKTKNYCKKRFKNLWKLLKN